MSILTEILALLMIWWIFWPALIGLGAFLLWCVVDEERWSPSTSIWPLAGIGALVYLAGWWPSLSIWTWALIALVYLPIGSGYSVFRWKMFVRDRAREAMEFIRDMRSRFDQEAKRQAALGHGTSETFEQALIDRYGLRVEQPKASENKGRIYIWILYWPVSFAAYVMRDMVTHLLREIFMRLSRIYDRISATEWTSVSDETKR